MPQHPPPSHRLRRAGRNVAVGPDRDPLSVNRCRVGLEVTELLLLLGIQPPFTTSLFWRFVKAAVLIGHVDGLTKQLSCLPHKRQLVSDYKNSPFYRLG